MNRQQRLKERQINAIRALGGENTGRIIALIDAIERKHQRKALAYCNDPQADGWYERWSAEQDIDLYRIADKLPNMETGALFINQDPRGFSVKLNNETEQGKRAIELSGCVTDWGGYGLLQTEAYKDND